MLRSLRIENFRRIKALDIRRLQRLNLVTGRNGGGKTSLLEAVFLNGGAANAGLILSLAAFRGDNVIQSESDRVFRSCFNNLETSRHIYISAEESFQKRSRSRSLRIEALTRSQTAPGRSAPQIFVSGVRSRFSGPSGEIVSEIELVPPPQRVPGIAPAPFNPLRQVSPKNPDLIFAQFVSPYVRDVQQEVYNQLVSAIKDKKLPSVLEVVSVIEKDVKDIIPLMELHQPNIYVDTGLSNLLPISVLGAGFLHLLRLALAIVAVQKGMIIVDELEDGVHFSILRDVARIIYRALENRDVQIFISTHSGELIEAFVEVAAELGYEDLCLLNMSPTSEGFSARYFDKGEIQYALDLNAELR